MSIYTHKILLFWLIYIVTIIGSIGIAGYTGILQNGFLFDKSHLTFVIFGFWMISEIIIGFIIYNSSKQLSNLQLIKKWLKENPLTDITIIDGVITLKSDTTYYTLKNDWFSRHINNLILRYTQSSRKSSFNQKILLDSLSDKIFTKNNWAYNSSTTIILLGLVGTVVGIILTFYPFLDATVIIDVNRIKESLGLIFAGVGAAFYPSAFSAIICVFLQFLDKILSIASAEIVDEITNLSETYILPCLEKTDE